MFPHSVTKSHCLSTKQSVNGHPSLENAILTKCHNNKTRIYQTMCALLEKMVNLNKSKKSWTKFATKSSWNKKNVKKSAIQFFISKPAAT